MNEFRVSSPFRPEPFRSECVLAASIFFSLIEDTLTLMGQGGGRKEASVSW